MTGLVRTCGVAVLVGAALAVAWSVYATGRRGRAGLDRARLLVGLPACAGRGGVRNGLRRRHERVPARELLYRWPTAVAVGAGAAALAGGAVGAVLGVAVALGTRAWQRSARGVVAARERSGGRAGAERVRGQLPMAADLLAACLEAGAGPCEAAEAVGRSIGDPLGGMLQRVAAELRLGGDPGQCWARFGAEPGAAALGRCMERACRSGAPPVRQVDALAAESRASQVRSGQAKARRAGVLATAPLGLCFLPAFLLVGVVPIVIGLAKTILAPS